MNLPLRQRPLAVGPVRAFESVARHLSFRVAAEELYLTQSAISRQIRALEDDVGAALFSRGTRHVALTSEGITLLRAVAPWLDRMDAAVRQIRQARGRRIVSVSTFASFASLWLIPRLANFQQAHPEVDIRISASDALIEPGSGDGDVALRYCRPEQAPPGARRLFGERVTPAASPWLLEHARRTGEPLRAPRDLVRHALLEEESTRAGLGYITWRSWLTSQGEPDLQPARWLYFNYTHQQVQAAIAGQGLTLARLALSADVLARGELVELFEHARLSSPYAYWLVTAPAGSAGSDYAERPDLQRFCDWVLAEAGATRRAIGEIDETGEVAAPDASAAAEVSTAALEARAPRAR